MLRYSDFRYTRNQTVSMKFVFLLFTIFIAQLAISQNTHLKVQVNAQDLPNGMGRGLVYALPDTSLIKGNYIDSNRFDVYFNAKIGDAYLLKIVAPGFADTLVPFIVNDTLVTLDPINLGADLTFDEVKVVYEKPVFERTMNGLSVNVKGTTLEELNTLFDILKASPKLSSPDDESIEIIGRGVPLILIDRQPIISNEELKAIPASEVDKIEIITNPSAKYRAQGSGNGVIEVYTNNFSLQGYRAHIRANGGIDSRLYPEGGANVGLNFKKGKFSVNGNYGTHYNKGIQIGSSSFYTADSSIYSNTQSDGLNSFRWQYYKLNMGYDISDSQRLSFGVGGHGSNGSYSSTSTSEYFTQDTLRTSRNNFNESTWKWQNYKAFVNYSLETDTIGSALEATFNFTKRISDSDDRFESDFVNEMTQSATHYDVLGTSFDRPNVGELRLNYEHYLDSNEILEFGIDASVLLNQKRFNRFNYENDMWVEDPVYTNSYDYKEYIGGAFAQYSRKWKKFGFQIGLRGEYTKLDGFSQTLDQQFMDSSYILPFPNAGILIEPNDNVAITAYYSSGIDRPSFSNYDPFVRIIDSLSIQYGNPYLRPSYNHTVGLELDLFMAYNLSLSYSRYNDMASTLTFIDPETYIQTSTPWNADYSETYSLSLSLPIDLEWLDGWNSFWIDYNNYVFTDVFQRDPFSNVTFGFHSYLTFKLPRDFNIMNRFFINQWGNDLFKSNANRSWAIRLTKQFKKPDLNIFAEVNSIAPNINRTTSYNGNYIANSSNQRSFTGYTIGVFYKFGKLRANTSVKETESGQSGRF